MEWENKIKMVALGNKRSNSPEDLKEFNNYVVENVESFDTQAWCMFCELTNIIVDEMIPDIEYWAKIYQHIKDLDPNLDCFGLRAGMRIAMIQEICETDLALNK